MTNYERIKAMSVEEMASEVLVFADCIWVMENQPCRLDPDRSCIECWEEWLESEVDT